MSGEKEKLVLEKVWEERSQGHTTRKYLYEELEDLIGLPVISFFTSFKYPVQIEDSDTDILEGIFQESDLSDGFVLLLSSPGGSGLAAERIINICRSYSGSGKYQVIVPGKAKSAATMICLGAQKIIMGKTSELGSIDPQIVYSAEDSDEAKWFSLHNIINSYEDLFEKAVSEDGNLEPYLQQLSNYDSREIEEFRSQVELSEDIAIKALKTGMMKGLEEEEIVESIKYLLTPEEVKIHGRPIYAKEAEDCGLNIDIKEPTSQFWSTVYELYVRLNFSVSQDEIGKCIESRNFSFKAKV